MSNEARGAVLFVASEARIADELRRITAELDLEAVFVESLLASLQVLPRRCVEVVWVELDPSEDFLEPWKRLVQACDGIPVVAVGGAETREAGGQLVATGATTYLRRPLGYEQAKRALKEALSHSEREEFSVRASLAPTSLSGDSRHAVQLRELVRKVAPGMATVLIRGESGTGKELVAREIHEQSARRAGPFVKVHSAAIPETLLESELFGYERGAFTGAMSRKPGRVELAQGGTLFLDEIGDLSQSLQVKLLRLLQDREFERLGGTEAIHADVRFLAATHRDLDGMVKRGEFRADLFYRLNVLTVWVPPLRARRDDIPVLAEHFCQAAGKHNGRTMRFAPEALDELRSLRWPGNVRQLENLVEKLVVLADGPTITAADVIHELSQEGAPFSTQTTRRPAAAASAEEDEDEVLSLDLEVRNAERRALLRALERTGGNRSLAARVLGVSRATLYKKIAEHGIE